MYACSFLYDVTDSRALSAWAPGEWVRRMSGSGQEVCLRSLYPLSHWVVCTCVWRICETWPAYALILCMWVSCWNECGALFTHHSPPNSPSRKGQGDQPNTSKSSFFYTGQIPLAKCVVLLPCLALVTYGKWLYSGAWGRDICFHCLLLTVLWAWALGQDSCNSLGSKGSWEGDLVLWWSFPRSFLCANSLSTP